MAFAVLPLMVVVFWLSLSVIGWQQAQAVPGAGPAGMLEARAIVTAQRAEMFGTSCVAAALAAPGALSQSLPVTLPPGVVLPAGAVCMTTAAPGNGRNVYALLPAQPGAFGRVRSDTQSNIAWFRVVSAGSAFNLATGEMTAVPSTIPVGYLLNWVLTSS